MGLVDKLTHTSSPDCSYLPRYIQIFEKDLAAQHFIITEKQISDFIVHNCENEILGLAETFIWKRWSAM